MSWSRRKPAPAHPRVSCGLYAGGRPPGSGWLEGGQCQPPRRAAELRREGEPAGGAAGAGALRWAHAYRDLSVWAYSGPLWGFSPGQWLGKCEPMPRITKGAAETSVTDPQRSPRSDRSSVRRGEQKKLSILCVHSRRPTRSSG